jgi:hypothetical protein
MLSSALVSFELDRSPFLNCKPILVNHIITLFKPLIFFIFLIDFFSPLISLVTANRRRIPTADLAK